MPDSFQHLPHDPATAFAPRELGVPYPTTPEARPAGALNAGRYTVRFAASVEDLDAIQRLRFEVFNLELGEGLDSAFDSGRDHDDLDPLLHHLLIATADGDVVGTYRLQTSDMAARQRGFYSAGEYDLSTMPAEFIANAVEVGRACVAKGHRNGRVLNLLWRGLAMYLIHNRKRYLFGCCSLTSQEPALGIATWRKLSADGSTDPRIMVPALPGFSCEPVDEAEVVRQAPHIPPLFQSYLNLGAKVCSAPALDRTFKTIDFLVALDVTALDEHSYRFFFR
ncbi:MAG TPA: GNAT family N-acyltransferase [Gemmatimonadales bacterium]|nr:GNAT family N-acyltransferase [Gemmatimonadales bacterium]